MQMDALQTELARAVGDAVALRTTSPLEFIAYALLRSDLTPPSTDESDDEYVRRHELLPTLQAALASVGEPRSSARVGEALLSAVDKLRAHQSGAALAALRLDMARLEAERAQLATSLDRLVLPASARHLQVLAQHEAQLGPARLSLETMGALAEDGVTLNAALREAGVEAPGRALSSEPDSFDASRECVARMRKALLALPDDAPGQPRFVEKYASDNSTVLHGTTSCIPHGLTRSMEAEFKDNDRDEGATEGKWWPNYRYVVYETAVEEAIQVYDLAPIHTRDKGRAGWSLKDFTSTPQARRAHLSQAEVAAVRVYTSDWFPTVNRALRFRDLKVIEAWATTISLMTSAIIKLSELSPLDQRCYRSMPADFPALRTFRGASAAETVVDPAFMSCSLDPDYVAAYNGGKHTEGTLLVYEPTFASRGADVAFLSQFPEQAEVTFPPSTSFRIVAVERLPTLPKYIALVQPQICAMRHFTEGLRYPWSSPLDPLSHDEYELTLETERERRGEGSTGKFGSEMCEMITGEPKLAALGLESYLGITDLPALLGKSGASTSRVGAIEAEFGAAGDAELLWWLHYVQHEPASTSSVRWGTRDTGHEGMRLADFCARPEAAHLTVEHVLALRLYTCTPVSFALNAPLRTFRRDADGHLARPIAMRDPYPFPVTVLLIHEAIKRLRDAEGDQVVTLWRGAKNMRMARDFLRGGGVEMAPMSTSYSLATALFYSHSPNSILFKLVTRSFMERGADVAWLSAFPGERECLFPPLTFLSPTGRVQKVGETFTVIEVTPRL